MENIYVQSEREMNSIVEIPGGYAADAGNTLYSWLGSLWRGLHAGDGMVRGLQRARGIRLAQLYIDVLEAARLQDREGAPVFHRELWHPIVVRASRRDTAQENMLELGKGSMRVGPQPAGSEYGEGAVFRMGRMAGFEGCVTYPLDADVAGGALSIVDNVVNPTVSMERGVDFEIRNGSVIFPKGNDPLGDSSPFERYDLPELVEGPDGVKSADVEAVLWASDVLIDRNYISDHLSYALGADAPSSAAVKRILNAAWSSVADGLTPELVKTLMAAMLNVPAILDETETVRDITFERDAGGNAAARIVRTDRHAYRVSMKATLLRSVRVGATLHRGDLLDETVRIYPHMNVRPGEDRYSVPARLDIPSVTLPSAILRARTEHGVYAMWGESEVRRSASSPGTDDRPHLYFDLGGTEADVSAFWEGVWRDADASGTDLSKVIVGKKVSPAEFMLRNLVGANTLFVVVDRSQADDVSMMRDPMFFDMLSDAVPSAMRLFLVEHDAVGGDDAADMGAGLETTSLHASLSAGDAISAAPLPGMGGRPPSFGERVSARFVRVPPAKVRGRKGGL